MSKYYLAVQFQLLTASSYFSILFSSSIGEDVHVKQIRRRGVGGHHSRRLLVSR
jgi:hypothetical protein